MNREMIKILCVGLALLAVALVLPAAADTVIVRPGEMGNWVGAAQQGTSSTAPVTEFVSAPGAPAGDGAYHMQVFYSDTDPISKIYLGTNDYSGIPLSSITSMKYSTYVQYRVIDEFDRKGHAPMIELVTDSGIVADVHKPQQRVFWFRPWGVLGSTNDLMRTWQEWDLLASDGYWEMMQTGSSNYYGNWDWVKARYGDAGTMKLQTPAVGDYVDPYNALLQVGNQSGTSLSIKIGSGKAVESRYGAWWHESCGINAYVDKLTIGINGVETTYDLEPPLMPTVIVRGSSATHAIMEQAKALFKFSVYGEVVDTDYYSYLTLDDKSGRTVKVVVENFVAAPGAFVKATGLLNNQADPPTLTSTADQMEVLAEPQL